MKSAPGRFAAAALLALLAAACAGAPEPTLTPTPTDTATPPPTPTETYTPPPTETPEPIATLAPTESGEFISPYTPSAPTGSGATKDPVVLKLNLQEGAVYRIRMLSSQNLSQSFEGQTFDIAQESGFEYTYTVTSLEPDGSAWIDVRYTRALLEIDSLFASEAYDSADPGPIPEGAEGIAAIVGSGFSIRIKPDGEVLEIEGLDEMYDQMLAGMDIADPELRQTLEFTFQEQFGEQAMKEQIGSLLFEFPEGSLTVGDSWTTIQETTAMVPIVAENTFTLLDFDENTALIEVSSDIRTGSQEGGVDLGLFEFDFVVTGAQEGLIQIDLRTGLSNSIIDQKMSGEMTVVVEGEQVTVPLDITQTIQVESVQIAP
jgi:hypothetical protein